MRVAAFAEDLVRVTDLHRRGQTKAHVVRVCLRAVDTEWLGRARLDNVLATEQEIRQRSAPQKPAVSHRA